jgi:hypothetical protein
LHKKARNFLAARDVIGVDRRVDFILFSPITPSSVFVSRFLSSDVCFSHVGSLVEAFYTTPEFCLVAVNIPDPPKTKGKSSRKGDKSHSQRANVVAFVLGSIIVHSRCSLQAHENTFSFVSLFK